MILRLYGFLINRLAIGILIIILENICDIIATTNFLILE